MIRPRTIDSGSARCRRPGFTLIELVVVAGIITLLLAMTLPALSAMWAQRKQADVQNTLRGVLSSARVQAKSHGERGLFFCLIDGVQKVFPIQREPANPGGIPTDAADGVTESDAADRFSVIEGQVHTFPAPFRVVPRYVVDDTSNGYDEWNAAELTNEDYQDPPDPKTQIHRNFFAVIFSSEGRLVFRRSVVIRDQDALPLPNGDNFGDRTGLEVGKITTYVDEQGMSVPAMTGAGLDHVLVSTNNTEGLNFVSVDGILVYDESLFRELIPVDIDGTLRQELIIATGQPMYVSRVTGEIIMGPTSENEAPPP